MSKNNQNATNDNSKDRTFQKKSQRSNLINGIDSLRTTMKKQNASLPRTSSSNMNRGIIAVFIILIVGGLIFYVYLAVPPTPPTIVLPSGHQSCTSLGGFTCDASAIPWTQNGEVVVFYAGAEYCPFCAAERWAMVNALEAFGNFSSNTLGQIVTPQDGSISPIYTYTFVNAVYTSSYIVFEPVETEDTNHQPLQQLDSYQSQIFNAYDPSGSIPFLSIGGKYFKVGSGVDVQALEGLIFSQIQQELTSQSGAAYTAITTESNNILAVLNTFISPSTASLLIQHTFHTQIAIHVDLPLLDTTKITYALQN